MDAPPSPDPGPENSDFAEYQQQLSLFSSCSTEKGIELLKIGMVIATLLERRTFLDIGAGGGHLTIPVSHMFEKTTVVEPNPRQAAMFSRRCPGFRVFTGSWMDVDIKNDRFDLILCSHVLYYIPGGTWMATIEKMYRSLSPGGSLVIVVQSPLGEVARFFNVFTSYDVPVIELARDVIGRYGDDAVRLEYFQNEIFTESLDDLVEIGLFLLIDRNFRQRTVEIRHYLQEHHAVAGGYRIVQDEILLVVHKSL